MWTTQGSQTFAAAAAARHRQEKKKERELCSQEMESKEKRNWQKTVNNCPFPQTTKKEVTEKWTYYLNFRWETLTVMGPKGRTNKDSL